MKDEATPEQSTCSLPDNDAIFLRYHDNEWGIPKSDDQDFFEKICLEGFQSGLSWRTILHKREAFRSAFSQFDMTAVAQLTEFDVNLLTQNVQIVRNRRKIRSAINNAQRARELQLEFGSIAAFFWQFEPKQSQRPHRVTHQWLAENSQTLESAALAKALKKRGWTFVGPTNMYALMQAYGIVNDHVHGCPRKRAVDVLRETFVPPTIAHC